MEGIPEKDMEERRRVLEQKNQGGTKNLNISYCLYVICPRVLLCYSLFIRDPEEKAEPG